jgi:hypothetical protein
MSLPSDPATKHRRSMWLGPGLVVLVSLLIVAVYLWVTLGDSQLSTNGVVALALGILGTVALGAGLMALVFYSHRHGYDDRVAGRSDGKEG